LPAISDRVTEKNHALLVRSGRGQETVLFLIAREVVAIGAAYSHFFVVEGRAKMRFNLVDRLPEGIEMFARVGREGRGLRNCVRNLQINFRVRDKLIKNTY